MGEACKDEASLVGGEAVKVWVAVNSTLFEVVLKFLDCASVLGLGWAGVCIDGGRDSSVERIQEVVSLSRGWICNWEGFCGEGFEERRRDVRSASDK